MKRVTAAWNPYLKSGTNISETEVRNEYIQSSRVELRDTLLSGPNIRTKLLSPGLELDYEYLNGTSSYIPKAKSHSLPAQSAEANAGSYEEFEFANGDEYEGQFDGQGLFGPERNGWGRYTCKDQSVFEGTWNEDKLSGADCFINLVPETTKFKGIMRKGNFEGFGIYRGRSGLYQGGFSDDKFYGFGRLVTSDGLTWTGRFEREGASHLQLDLQLSRDSADY